MKRRDFVVAAAVGSAVSLQGATENLQPLDSQISIADSSEYLLLRMLASNDGLCALLRKRSDRTQYRISKVNSSASQSWDASLSGGFVMDTCVTPQGELIVLMRRQTPSLGLQSGITRLHYSSSGQLLRSFEAELPVGLLSFAASATTLVAYYSDGSVLLKELAGQSRGQQISGVLLPIAISGYTPNFLMVSVEIVGAGSACIIDQTTGRIALLDIASGRYQTSTIDDPAIEQGKASAQRLISAMGSLGNSTGTPTQSAAPKVIGATAANTAGNIACLPAPISPTKPLVLQLDPTGRVLKRFRCSLPDRSGRPDKMPVFISSWIDRVAIGFPEGDIFTYKV